MKGNNGIYKFNLYREIKNIIPTLQGKTGGLQLLSDTSWTENDIFEVAYGVSQKLLHKVKVHLRGQEVYCRLYENGNIEFRLEK